MLALTALLISALLASQSAPQSAPAQSAPTQAPPQAKPVAPEKKPAAKITGKQSAPSATAAKTERRAKEGSKSSGIVIPTPRPRPPEIPSYRVSLRMKNGRRFMGIVSRDKAFHDLVHSGAHHTDSAYKRADRFMLRFVDGLDGEIELKWSQVSKLEVREILDSAGLRAMESDYFHARTVRNAALDVPADPAAEPAAEGAPAEGAGGEAKPAGAPEGEGDASKPDAPDADGKDDAKKKEEPALITEFSPQSGWTPDRKKQIEWRRTVVGAFPDAREQRFLDVYDEWLPQYDKWVKEEQERLEADAAKSKGDGRGAPKKTDEKSDAKSPEKAPESGDARNDAKSPPPAPKDPPKEGGRS